MPEYLDTATLLELAQRAEMLATSPCTCTKTSLEGWQSQPLSLDETQLKELGTLSPVESAEDEWTFPARNIKPR